MSEPVRAKGEGTRETVRADVWLWAVRLYKTRNQAAGACRKGQVRVQGLAIKPSRGLRTGDELQVERGYLAAHYRVRALLSQRVGAKLVGEFLEDLTSEEEREKARQLALLNRPLPGASAGKGRPTKKDRRDLEEWADPGTLPIDPDEAERMWRKAIR